MTALEVKRILRRFPRAVLCDYDTPVQRMSNLEKSVNAGRMYIKRDDLNGVGPGGNKVRALEYLLGEALDKGSDVIIASGMQNSNLCTIAAAACCKLGVRCVLVHNNQSEIPTGNTLLNHLMGVDRIYIGDCPESERNEYIDELVRKYEGEGLRPFVIENGASTVTGAMGYIHAVLELYEQENECALSDVFVAGGNGGLASGIIFGAGLLDIPFHIHVITVEHETQRLEALLRGFIAELEKKTGVTLPYAFDEIATIHGAYRGEGWGIPTAESERMIYDLASAEGIFVEHVYTSKTVYGMVDLLRRKKIDATSSCAIHSGGFGALFGQFSA